MPDNLQVISRKRRNLRVTLKKVVKIRQLLQFAQGRRRNLPLRLNNQVRRKNRLLLLKKPAPAPNRKLPGQINKSMLTGHFVPAGVGSSAVPLRFSLLKNGGFDRLNNRFLRWPPYGAAPLPTAFK